MCRMLGLLSVRRTDAYAPLVETDKSLWRQSFADPKQPQRDGWGVARYRGAVSGRERAACFLSPRPLARQKRLLERTAARARGRILLFHLRRASNPRGLPLRRLRGRTNTQPFQDGPWTFAHNGSIPFPDAAARSLGSYRRRVRGLNDSEVVFWTLRRELRRGRPVPAALRALKRRLREIFLHEQHKVENKARSPHRGLNILLSNGESLWAYAEAPPNASRGSALCSKNWPYFRLAFLPSPDRVWVASEPLWSGGRWRPVRSGELLECRAQNGRVVWRKRRLI